MSLVRLQIALATLCLAFLAAPAWGHGVDLYARVEGGQLTGSMSFADGAPAGDRVVRAFAPDGSVMEETRTDENGRFTMPVRFSVRYRLVGEAGEGHRGLYTVPESEIQSAIPAESAGGADDGSEGAAGSDSGPKAVAGVDLGAVEAAVARQLGPLRDQLHAHEKRVRLRDVLGGIGYIFGLAGLYVLLKGRRSPGAPGADA